MNIRLGTRYLRQMLDRFGGVQEYALAAYNAGDSRVADWQAAGPYSGIDEFVESIPFTRRANTSRPYCATRKPTGRSTILPAPTARPRRRRPVRLNRSHRDSGESHLPLPGDDSH